MKHKITNSLLGNVVILFIVLLLAGCKVELYSGLGENEGNEMLAILLDGNILAEKIQDKDKNLTLIIKVEDVSKSINLLKSYGYPKEKFSSVGDIFPKEGLISSPTEERARYTYSMSQELSATLSMIDGVITARVHVVLPQDTSSLTEITYPSSASIFIKYTPELELSGFIPKVKTLVSNSIEGLSLDKISVSLFPATRINQGVSGADFSEEGQNNKSGIGTKVMIFVFIFIMLAGLIGFIALMQKKGLINVGFLNKFKKNKGEDDLSESMQIENVHE